MGLNYKRATEKDVPSIAKLQTEVFLKSEPMTMALKFTEKEYYDYLVKLYSKTITDTLTYVAVDEDNGIMAGMFVAVDMCGTEVDIAFSEVEKAAVELSNSFFALFDDALAGYEINKPNTAILLSYAATDERYLRQGIMAQLTDLCEKAAIGVGAKYLLGFTTNYKSFTHYEKDKRFKPLKSIEYASCGISEFSATTGECTLFVREV